MEKFPIFLKFNKYVSVPGSRVDLKIFLKLQMGSWLIVKEYLFHIISKMIAILKLISEVLYLVCADCQDFSRVFFVNLFDLCFSDWKKSCRLSKSGQIVVSKTKQSKS